MRLEEAAVQRRHKLQNRQTVVGVANGNSRLSVDGDPLSLSQLQRKKAELGELLITFLHRCMCIGWWYVIVTTHYLHVHVL